MTLPFVLASLAIGVFVSTLARTSAQSVFITVFFILPSFVLSGVMFPYQLMPPAVRSRRPPPAALVPDRAAPAHHARRGLDGHHRPLLALLAIFAGLLALIRWRLKPRLA